MMPLGSGVLYKELKLKCGLMGQQHVTLPWHVLYLAIIEDKTKQDYNVAYVMARD